MNKWIDESIINLSKVVSAMPTLSMPASNDNSQQNMVTSQEKLDLTYYDKEVKFKTAFIKTQLQ